MTHQILGASPSVNTDIANGDLVITWWDHGSDTHEPVAVTRVPMQGVENFVRDVTSHGLRSLAWGLVQATTGECERCHNTGMVEEENRHGRMERVHCPDCKARRKDPHTILKKAPRVVPSGFRE